MWLSNKGRFLKQFFVNFPSGEEIYAWIFLKENGMITYGHRTKDVSGSKNFFVSPKDVDIFELVELERRMVSSLGLTATISQAKLSVLEFPDDTSFEQQIDVMKKLGMSEEDYHLEEIQKREREIKQLEELWNKNTEDIDYSSTNWLFECIKKWESTNKEKGRLVEFLGAFFAIDPVNEFEVKEDKFFAYGLKKTILNSLDQMKKKIKKEKDDFINI